MRHPIIRHLCLTLLVSTLTGCGFYSQAKGPTFSDSLPPPQQSILYVYSTPTQQHAGIRVQVDKQPSKILKPHGYVSFPIQPGRHTIATSMAGNLNLYPSKTIISVKKQDTLFMKVLINTSISPASSGIVVINTTQNQLMKKSQALHEIKGTQLSE